VTRLSLRWTVSSRFGRGAYLCQRSQLRLLLFKLHRVCWVDTTRTITYLTQQHTTIIKTFPPRPEGLSVSTPKRPVSRRHFRAADTVIHTDAASLRQASVSGCPS